MQVLSLTTPALHDLGPESVDMARRANDALAAAIARQPTRFQALATLPVAMPEEAALELERCVRTLGFKGTMLCGRVGARNLDHPTFAPIFQSAEALGAPVLLHPRAPDMAVRATYYSGFRPEVDAAFATYGLGWHYDAGVQFLRLVLSGTFDRMPGLQVILGHWGELVLFYAERLAAMDRVSDRRTLSAWARTWHSEIVSNGFLSEPRGMQRRRAVEIGVGPLHGKIIHERPHLS